MRDTSLQHSYDCFKLDTKLLVFTLVQCVDFSIMYPVLLTYPLTAIFVLDKMPKNGGSSGYEMQ